MCKKGIGKIVQSINTFLERFGLYCFAAVILVLNYSLAFDNVVWGDEAFSTTAIVGTDLYGIYQRIYFWDSHPPLYYYWLRLFADIFGYNIPVYHIASLVPFTIGILLAVFPIRKKLGKIPAAFFVLLSGLSAPCAEYNQEIRMYALTFLEMLIGAYCSYRIMENNHKKRFWVGLTLSGVAAAYSHYFGLVTSGILLFVTGLIYFLRNRKKTWLYGVISILTYIVLYSPWLYVFFRQASSVSNSWWLEEIAPLDVLTNMIFCGVNMKTILMPIVIVCSLVILVTESKVVHLTLPKGSRALSWKFSKPGTQNWSVELYGIVLFWAAIVLTVGFTYVASLLINPLTIARYMYPVVPLAIFILMLCIRRFLAYGKVNWGNEDYGVVQKEENAEHISLLNTESPNWTRAMFGCISLVFVVTLIVGLLDFKFYRSLSITQNVQTQKILSIIGEPEEDAVFTATGVQHLSWTVLPHYFPEHEVLGYMPEEIETEASEIWAFIGFYLSDESVNQMKEMGYTMEMFEDCWMGKYGCNLYHFYK